MRKFLGGGVLLSVLLVSVLGFFLMHPDGMERMAGCIAAVVSGATCPVASPLAVSIFHLEAFKNLSLAIVGEAAQSSAGVLAALFFILISFLLVPISRDQNLGRSVGRGVHAYLVSRARLWESVRSTSLALRRLLCSLSFFTHSPCVA